jgi:hypothetical protein
MELPQKPSKTIVCQFGVGDYHHAILNNLKLGRLPIFNVELSQ